MTATATAAEGGADRPYQHARRADLPARRQRAGGGHRGGHGGDACLGLEACSQEAIGHVSGTEEGDGFVMAILLPGCTLPELGFLVGAGEGNRTLMTSLEGWGSAIELRPRGGYTRRNRKQAAKPVAYRLAAPDQSLCSRDSDLGREPSSGSRWSVGTLCQRLRQAARMGVPGEGRLRLAAGM